MDNHPFIEFEHHHPTELPGGEMYVSSYSVKAAYYPAFEYDEELCEHVFSDVRFELLEVWRTDAAKPYLIPSFGTNPSMVEFTNTLKDKARKIYDQRHGSTDFETVTIHDRVNGQAVTVFDNLQNA